MQISVSINEVLLEQSMSIHLHIVYECFLAQVSNCNLDYTTHKPNISGPQKKFCDPSSEK